jgi:hypothetical protein
LAPPSAYFYDIGRFNLIRLPNSLGIEAGSRPF